MVKINLILTAFYLLACVLITAKSAYIDNLIYKNDRQNDNEYTNKLRKLLSKLNGYEDSSEVTSDLFNNLDNDNYEVVKRGRFLVSKKDVDMDNSNDSNEVQTYLVNNNNKQNFRRSVWQKLYLVHLCQKFKTNIDCADLVRS